jgi:hypothetical protein
MLRFAMAKTRRLASPSEAATPSPPIPLRTPFWNTSRLICEAIAARTLLEFGYDGHRRIVAPYLHGAGRRNVDLLRGVQVGGSSRSGQFGVGKLWTVAKMVDVRPTGETFVPDDPSYNPVDLAMIRIHCRV